MKLIKYFHSLFYAKPSDSAIQLDQFELLPNYLKSELSSFLDLPSKIRLATASKNLHLGLKDEINYLTHKTLLQAVLDDDYEKVESILKTRPAFLVLKPPSNMILESKKTWQRFFAERPLELALKRGQVTMVKKLLPYFNQLDPENGNALALDQWKTKEFSFDSSERLINQLKQIITVFSKETKDRPYLPLMQDLNDNTILSIVSMRTQLNPQKPIRLDDYDDARQVLALMLKVYRDHYHQFQNGTQRYLYCILIIGYGFSVLPPEMAQICCDGLSRRNQNYNHDFLRKKRPYFIDETTPFYRSSRQSEQGLGFDFYVDSSAGFKKNALALIPFVPSSIQLQEYIEHTTSEINELKCGLQKVLTPRCGIL